MLKVEKDHVNSLIRIVAQNGSHKGGWTASYGNFAYLRLNGQEYIAGDEYSGLPKPLVVYRLVEAVEETPTNPLVELEAAISTQYDTIAALVKIRAPQSALDDAFDVLRELQRQVVNAEMEEAPITLPDPGRQEYLSYSAVEITVEEGERELALLQAVMAAQEVVTNASSREHSFGYVLVRADQVIVDNRVLEELKEALLRYQSANENFLDAISGTNATSETKEY